MWYTQCFLILMTTIGGLNLYPLARTVISERLIIPCMFIPFCKLETISYCKDQPGCRSFTNDSFMTIWRWLLFYYYFIFSKKNKSARLKRLSGERLFPFQSGIRVFIIFKFFYGGVFVVDFQRFKYRFYELVWIEYFCCNGSGDLSSS